ncbi:helix-turn-helix domain-containing protein [Spongiivirga sp. MCCC 1A20706]|uniref:helix-turn-helix domain-containing protein n=1 Tax=Spongiivirga sp. MCCC 1A20706 TaxID=3160963 RepID=UPI003977AFDB
MKEKNILKEHRINNHLTQEELANQSGISIRTIQRIEKGLTSGSPHTIKALAKALNIQNQELRVLNENQPLEKSNNFNKVKLLNFSILSVLLIPFGNIILPTILFYKHRTNQNVNTIGRKIISFQIVTTILLFFFSVIIFLVIGRGNGAIPLPVFICYFMVAIINIIIVTRTSIDIDKKREVLKFFPDLL